MKRLMLAVLTVAALVALPRIAAAQAAHHPDSPKATLHTTDSLTVGSTVLAPAEYRFQCRNIGGKDFLIVTLMETGKEVARVPCTPEQLKEPVTTSQFHTANRNGVKTLTSVRIKGESIAHVVVTD